MLVGIPPISEPLGNKITKCFDEFLVITPLLPILLNTLCKLEPLASPNFVAVCEPPYEYVNEPLPILLSFIIASTNPISVNGVGTGGVEPSSLVIPTAVL